MKSREVYVSLPISGQEKTIKERCEKIIDYCERHYPDYDLIFPPDLEDSKEDVQPHNYAWYLGNDLLIISKCDAILMTMGWEESLGCRIEHDVALKSGIKILYMEMED